MPLILLAVLAVVPVFLALVFRVSAIYLFLSLAVGDLLVKYLSDDVSLTIDMVSRSSQVPMITALCLLFLPVVLTLSLLRKSLPTSKLMLHIVPLALTGLTAAVFALPLLDSNTQAEIFALPAGNILRQAQDLIVGVAGVSVLTLIWISRPHHGKGKHGH